MGPNTPGILFQRGDKDTDREREEHVRTQKGGRLTRRKDAEETNPDDTLTLDFQPSDYTGKILICGVFL